MEKKIEVIIVDDHEIFRNGLKMVINRFHDTKIIAEASNGRDFLALLDKHTPDIILMDIEMPVMNGIDATKIALNTFPDLKIIVLTMFNDEAYIQNMIDLGVKGFLIKNINKQDLNKAIQKVYNGGNYYSDELFSFFNKQMTKNKKAANKNDELKLTPREKEILQLLAQGLNNKEIANKLFVSERTIIGHKSNLLSKTACKSTISLLSFAIRNNLVSI